MSFQIVKTSLGVMLVENFSSPIDWANDGGWVAESNPSLISFGYTPLPALTPGPNPSADYGGVREGHLFVEGDTWTLFYGAGDGTAGVNGGWKPQSATSTDGGLTWTRNGPSLPNDGKVRDMLYMEKRGSTYYLHSMIGASNTLADDGRGYVPNAPYTSDIWTATNINGPWTFAGPGVDRGASGSFDETSAYASSVVDDGAGNLQLFYGTRDAGLNLNVGRSVSTDPAGPFTKTAGPIIDATDYLPENPKVFYHPKLNVYVMLINEASPTGPGQTDLNALKISSSLTNWTSKPDYWYQHASQMDGPDVVGLASPFYVAEGLPLIDSNGYVPATYDSFPVDTTGSDVHVGRRVLYMVLEPSPSSLSYTPVGGGGSTTLFSDNFNAPPGTDLQLGYGNGWLAVAGNGGNSTIVATGTLSMGTGVGATIAVQSGVNVADCTVSANLTIVNNTGIGFLFRYADVNNWYLINMGHEANQTAVSFQCFKLVAGTLTQIGGLVAGPIIAYGTPFNAEITLAGDTFTCKVNGSYYATFTDSEITAAGNIGLRNGNSGVGTRNLDTFLITTPTTLDTAHQYEKIFAHTDFTAEFVADFSAIPAGFAGFGFDYRIQANGDRYRASLIPGEGLKLQKSTGGTFTDLASSTGTQITSINYSHRVKVKVAGNAHTLNLDGETQVTYTDSGSPYASGNSIAFMGMGVGVRVRLVHLRTGDQIAITGLTDGQLVTLRAPGGIPVETGTVSGTSYTSTTIKHYPLDSVDIDGVNHRVSGLIWGGDTLNYSFVTGGMSVVTIDSSWLSSNGNGGLPPYVLSADNTIYNLTLDVRVTNFSGQVFQITGENSFLKMNGFKVYVDGWGIDQHTEKLHGSSHETRAVSNNPIRNVSGGKVFLGGKFMNINVDPTDSEKINANSLS